MGTRRQALFFTAVVVTSFGAGLGADRLVTRSNVDDDVDDGSGHRGEVSSNRHPPLRLSRLPASLSPSFPEPDELHPGAPADELFARALASTDFEEQMGLLRAAAERLAPGEAEVALTWVADLRASRARETFTAEVLRRLGEEQPERALNLAGELLPGGSRRHTVMVVLESWLERDRRRATAWASALPEGAERADAMRTVVDTLAVTDPERAFALARGLGPMASEMSMMTIFERWAERDPEAAAEAVATLPVSMTRMMAVSSLAQRWGATDPQRALAWARGLGTTEASRAIESILRERSMRDAGDAFEIALEVEGLPEHLLSSLGAQWVHDDRDGAIAAIRAMPSSPRRTSLLRSAAFELAFEHPREAAALAEQLEPGPDRRQVLSRVAGALAEEDVEAAARWVLSLDGQEQESALSSVMLHWAEVDPRAAASFVARLPDASSRAGVAMEVAAIWSRHDPAEAARWVLSNGLDEPSVVNELVWSWSSLDEEAAGRWTSSLPPGAGRDQALGVMASNIATRDPSSAWSWAERIEDPTERDSRLEQVAMDWLAVDREEAEARIDAADLPEEVRASLLGEEVASEATVEATVEESQPACCPCEVAEIEPFEDELDNEGV